MFISMSKIKGWLWLLLYPAITYILYRSLNFLPKGSKPRIWKDARIDASTALNSLKSNNRRHLLIFCPSLGEYESVKALIYYLRKEDPQLFIEITFFSPSGYIPLTSILPHQADYVSYSPPDTIPQVNEFFNDRKVDDVWISSLAIWPIFLSYLIRNEIQYSFLSAKAKGGFGARFYYHSLSFYLNKAQFIFCVDVHSKKYLSFLNAGQNIVVAGDPRNDSISLDLSITPLSLERIKKFKSKDLLLVLGSTHLEDEKVIFPAMEKIVSNWKILIVPHHIHRAKSLVKQLENAMLFSNYNSEPNVRVLVLDSIGLLKYFYLAADVSYIGGGFNKGLHNLLEPLQASSLVIVGKNIDGSNIAQTLIDQKLIFQVTDDRSFLQIINRLKDKSKRALIKEEIKNYIGKEQGAAQKILFILKNKTV